MNIYLKLVQWKTSFQLKIRKGGLFTFKRKRKQYDPLEFFFMNLCPTRLLIYESRRNMNRNPNVWQVRMILSYMWRILRIQTYLANVKYYQTLTTKYTSISFLAVSLSNPTNIVYTIWWWWRILYNQTNKSLVGTLLVLSTDYFLPPWNTTLKIRRSSQFAWSLSQMVKGK